MGDISIPVSYTHLDVYKRQTHNKGDKFSIKTTNILLIQMMWQLQQVITDFEETYKRLEIAAQIMGLEIIGTQKQLEPEINHGKTMKSWFEVVERAQKTGIEYADSWELPD